MQAFSSICIYRRFKTDPTKPAANVEYNPPTQHSGAKKWKVPSMEKNSAVKKESLQIWNLDHVVQTRSIRSHSFLVLVNCKVKVQQWHHCERFVLSCLVLVWDTSTCPENIIYHDGESGMWNKKPTYLVGKMPLWNIWRNRSLIIYKSGGVRWYTS